MCYYLLLLRKEQEEKKLKRERATSKSFTTLVSYKPNNNIIEKAQVYY